MHSKSQISRFPALLAALLLVLLSFPSGALDAIPSYSALSIGNLIRDAYPTAGISSATALNHNGDAVGYAMIDSRFSAFVYTQEYGLQLLPSLSADWPHHVAEDVTDRSADGHILIAGNALPAGSTDQNRDPGNALIWVYNVDTGTVVETVNVGVLPGYDLSRINSINNAGLAVGYSREEGFFGAIQPMLYDYTSDLLHAMIDLPFTPVAINNGNWVVGGGSGTDGAVRALLEADGRILMLQTLGHPAEASVGTATGINDQNAASATVGFPYTDGAGRFISGAARYTDEDGWIIAWNNSAFDSAHGLNNAGDLVGDTGVSNAIRAALYIGALDQTFLIEDLIDPPGYFVDSARDINDAGWIVGGSAGAVLLQRIGDMQPPTAPANLTAEPHYPTWQQPWNAITLIWENTSNRSLDYFVERRISGSGAWIEIKTNWKNLQLWDTSVELGTTYDYRVRARGLAGFSDYSNIATATAPADPVDNEAPVVAITQPVAGQTVSGTVTVMAEASDNIAVTYMDIEVQGSLGRRRLCSAVDVTVLSCQWNTRKLDPGTYVITAMAADAMNNGGYDQISVEVVPKSRGGGGGSGGDGSEKGRKKCTDGIDNDGDGLVDAADPDCQ